MKIKNIVVPLFLTAIFSSVPLAQTEYPDPPPDVVKAATASFHEYDTGNTFDGFLASGPNLPETIIIPTSYKSEAGGALPPGRPAYPSEHILGLVSTADFVGSAIPLKRWTYPTDSNCFTVSIYLVRVTGVAIPGKNSVTKNTTIYIARAGGPIVYNNHKFDGLDPGFPPFQLNHEYIFFGRLRTTNLYKVNSEQSLEVGQGYIGQMNSNASNPSRFVNRDKQSIFAEALQAWQELPSRLNGGGQ